MPAPEKVSGSEVSGPTWRIAVHALDRTGPPMLARSVLVWMTEHHPEVAVEVVAFRGGELLDDFVRLVPTHVLLDPSEPLDHAAPSPRRVEAVLRRCEGLGRVDATLLVSVAAGQCLPYLPDCGTPVLAWAVEQGEDLHWIDGPLQLRNRVTRWLAGSFGTLDELEELGLGAGTEVVPEFIGSTQVGDATVRNCRSALGVRPGNALVMGGGIATLRKGPDLFVEVASACRRRGASGLDFVWLGGERDPLFGLLVEEVERLGLENVRLMGSVVDIDPWVAAADVFLHPARLDAFPLVCLHAAAAGTPVVGFSGAGGLPEMFGDSFLGAPFPDVAGLAARLIELAEDARRSAALGAAQQSVVRSRHVADRAAPLLFERMGDLLRGTPGRRCSP